MITAAAPPAVLACSDVPGEGEKRYAPSDVQPSLPSSGATEQFPNGVTGDTVTDMTEWRRESCAEGEDSELDTRVEGAILALNDAISANNQVEVEYAEAARQLDELMRTANDELVALQQRHWRWLNEIASFEETKREAKLAVQQLSRISRDLAAAREEASCSAEALEILENQSSAMAEDAGGGSGDEDLAARETVMDRLRAQRDGARLAVVRLGGEQKQLSAAVKRLTERVVQKSRRVGDAFEGAMPFLARKQALIEQQQERHLELQMQLEETQRAKARVRSAMDALEHISLDIKERRTPSSSKRRDCGVDAAEGESLQGRDEADTASVRGSGGLAGQPNAEEGTSTGATMGSGLGAGAEGADQGTDNTSRLPGAVAGRTDHTTKPPADDGSPWHLSSEAVGARDAGCDAGCGAQQGAQQDAR